MVKDIEVINGTINKNKILSRLHNKTNYLSEMFQIKFAINLLAKNAPNCCHNICDHKNRDETNIQIDKSTKQLYEDFVRTQFVNPTGHKFLEQISSADSAVQKQFHSHVKLK